MREAVRTKLDTLPTAPGVYVFRDAAGGFLYVGKARTLRSRVRSYFQPGSSDDGNAIIIGLSGIVADVFAVASGSGVAPDDALKLLDFFNPAAIITGRGRNMARKNFTPSFELTMARKDVRLMMESANGAPLVMLPAIAARMDALIAEGFGASDLGVIGKDAVR